MKKDLNENPFKKDTPVIPFSNGSEGLQWQDQNCWGCANYEYESKNEKAAKCKLAFWLDFASTTGSIPLWVAKEIGCKYEPLYGFVKLENCRKLDDGTKPF